MSVCGQSGPAEDDSATDEVTPAAASATRDIYKQKPASKVVRVLTVLAYLLSVSLAAILLSVYYICVWRSPELPPEVAAGEGQASARLGNRTHYQRHHHHKIHVEHAAFPTANNYGGGDTTVNGDIIHSTPENITGGFNEDSVTESSSEAAPSATAPPDTTPGVNGSSAFSNNDTDSVT